MVKRVRLTADGRKRIGRTLSSKKQQIRKEKRTRRKESVSSIGEYEVGRGKPPKDTQFKKNDGRHRPGRPKGSKNLAALIMEAARDQVSVTIDGKPRKISKAKSAAIQLANKGAMGDPKLLGQFLDRLDEIETRAAASKPSEYTLSDADLEVIRAVHSRLRPWGKRGDD